WCAVVVASAVGPVDPQGAVGTRVLATISELAMPMRLPPSEEPRLAARLAWLLATRVNVDRLGRQTALLGEPELQIAGRYRASVARLLTAVFDADEPAAAPSPAAPTAGPAAPVDGADRIAGLDRAHSLLLRVLAARRSWTREEFAVLAGAHGVLPDGALDRLNDAAIDTAGAPAIECDATLPMNDDVLQGPPRGHI